MTDDSDLAKLARVKVLHLDKRVSARRLQLRWNYYEQRQHDGLGVEFDGTRREFGISYEEQRLRSLGWATVEAATNPAGPPGAVGFSSRRPSCPTTLAGWIVDTYTSMLLGEGREPNVRVVGDADSTETLTALFDAGYAWDAFAEARTFAGAEGAAAILPEILDGEIAFRAIRPEDLYIEWSPAKDWVPRIAIEQRRVEIEGLDERGQVCISHVWRTRAWDQRFSYIYEDVPIEHGQQSTEGGPAQRRQINDAIELAEAPKEHRAGRCPIVWLQNTRCSDDPIGKPDCDGVFELIDRLDHLRSMGLRGTTANLDPTLVIADKLYERKIAARRAKGYGNKIEVSEAGRASLLEFSGKTIEVGLLTEDAIRRSIETRTGVVVIHPDQAGAFATSGVALQILRGTANNRAAMRRPSLGRAIVQVARIVLEMSAAWGIRDIGAGGAGIALPPREVKSAKGETESGPYKVGPGRAIVLSWGELHSPTPSDLQVTAQALTVATGGRPVVSQESAVGLMIHTAQLDTDLPTEMQRIRSEAEERVASFESSMTPSADKELDDLLEGNDGEGEGEGEGGAEDPGSKPGKKVGAAVDDVQKQGLNGAQAQQIAAIVTQAGTTLSPGAAKILIPAMFPVIPPDAAAQAIDMQLEFVKSLPKPDPQSPPDPKQPRPQLPVEGA